MTPRVHNRLGVLHYGVRMLNRVLRDPGRDPIEENARLESFLLHARNLLGFLQDARNPRADDDVTCTDFRNCSGRPMKALLDRDDEWANDLKSWINKHLSHMTARSLKVKPGWEVKEIRSRINAHLLRFIRELHVEEFGDAGEAGRQEFLAVLGEAPSVASVSQGAPRLQLPMAAIGELCRRYQVRELSIFGSALRADFGDSDIDLLVSFKPEAHVGFEFVQFQRELSEVLKRDVDLVSKDGLKPAIRDRVLAEAQVLYAA